MKTPANPGPTRRPSAGMRMLRAEHRIVASSVFLLLLLPVTAACGDSDSGSAAADPKESSSRSTLDTDFISRAEAACAPYADYQANTFLDVPKFNRYSPDPSCCPRWRRTSAERGLHDAGLGLGGSGHTEVRRHRLGRRPRRLPGKRAGRAGRDRCRPLRRRRPLRRLRGPAGAEQDPAVQGPADRGTGRLQLFGSGGGPPQTPSAGALTSLPARIRASGHRVRDARFIPAAQTR